MATAKTTKTSSKTSSNAPNSFDVDEVKRAAGGRWPDILQRVGGFSQEELNGKAQPCPKCGGVDRFRMIDESTGAVRCNQCFPKKCGDGLAAIQWKLNLAFRDVLREVGGYLGLQPSNGHPGKGHGKPKPDAHLEWRPWNDFIVRRWCLKNEPITLEAVRAAGGRLARYRDKYTVLAFPIWGNQLDEADPVGWLVMQTNGVSLPLQGGQPVSKKLTRGSAKGVIGDINRLRNSARVLKTEGITDLLAAMSMPDLPPDMAVVTNAMGAQERPLDWIVELIGNKKRRNVLVVHDCDKPGQAGAIGGDETGGKRPGWANFLAASAMEVRNVLLPYPVTETHGKDLRDFFSDGNGITELLDIAASSPLVGYLPPEVNESFDDPHRLARAVLDKYQMEEGGTLRMWKGMWMDWRGGKYTYGMKDDVRCLVIKLIKRVFDEKNLQELEDYESKQQAGELEDGELPPYVKKVTPGVTNQVMDAIRSEVALDSELELGTWIPDRSARGYISLQNGLLDVEKLLDGSNDLKSVLLPHTPEWFSCAYLPYKYDPKATCPKWDAFLEKNLEMDPERIKLLQEWCGYLLLPDTGQQKFMIMVGDGANGKSVCCAAIEGMLGPANCSHVQFECFGDRFSKTETLGRLVNICADVGEMDKMAEGVVKAFTSGNSMQFEKKGLDSFHCQPTARLIIACNTLPKFRDTTDGIMRRLLLVPWNVQIQQHERVTNMDKAWWWRDQGELPGIFNWAMVGLDRLRSQGHFTHSELVEQATEQYRIDNNPTRLFVQEMLQPATSGRLLSSDYLYSLYACWMEAKGYRPSDERVFFKEINRILPSAVKTRRRDVTGQRRYCYLGVDYQRGVITTTREEAAYVSQR